jgi:N,N'-diacetyllegionaminate synthase
MSNARRPNLPILILEVANAHGGSFECVLQTIAAFSKLSYVGKHIKFQPFHPDSISLPDFEWYPVYRDLFFGKEQWAEVVSQAALTFDGVWLDIFDVYGVDIFLQSPEKVVGLKLQASVLENREVLNALQSCDLSRQALMLNISGNQISEIETAVDEFGALSAKKLVLQIGHQAYPTRLDDAGLQKVKILRAAFPGLQVCLADHTPADNNFATLVPLLGVAAGCDLIEKHICLDRSAAKYDYHSSLELVEVQALMSLLKTCPGILEGPFISKSEASYLEKSVQIPVAKRPLKRGSLVSEGDVVFRRTGQPGISFARVRGLQQQKRVLANDHVEGQTFQVDHYKPATVGVIVACRLKSSRLPGKALLPIAGRPSFERCLDNCRMIQSADAVVLATSVLEEDDALERQLEAGEVKVWRGDPDDVIHRYVGACDAFGIDTVIRVTADCPTVSSDIAEFLLEKHFESGADYTAPRECAVGTGCEIYNAEALRRVLDLLGSAEHSEYMTWYLKNNPDIFKVDIVDLPEEWIRDYRLTLDYPEDMELFNGLYEELEERQLKASLANVFAVLDQMPALAEKNAHLTLRYKTDQVLIAELNRLTRIPQQ